MDQWADVEGEAWESPEKWGSYQLNRWGLERRDPANYRPVNDPVRPNDLVWAIAWPHESRPALFHSDEACPVLEQDRLLAVRCGDDKAINKWRLRRLPLNRMACPECWRDLGAAAFPDCLVMTAKGPRHGSVLGWRATPKPQRWFAIVRYRDSAGDLIIEVRPRAEVEPDPN
ncbi:hypothetical protein AB0H49_01625 [Nocardia sp. NPDC050713]|uniref:hypothetical protein n=1 Tax=Nocardia sp. NPDC050713 TaxID=3154511 RepID=UPI0033DD605C